VNRLEVRALPLSVGRPQVLAAVTLIGVTAGGLDEASTASQVLRGLAVLLAATLALAVDEPAAELLDGTPTPWRRRVARRLAALAVLSVPLWLLGLGAVAWRGGDVSTGMLTLQLAAPESARAGAPGRAPAVAADGRAGRARGGRCWWGSCWRRTGCCGRCG
jgi:hypothetical protein